MSIEIPAGVDFANKFASALDYDSYLEKHGNDVDKSKWQSIYDSVELSSKQQDLLRGFTREMQVLCMAGAWCGDCVAQCPIFAHFEAESPMIRVRFIDRDADSELANELKICGGSRVPQIVFLSEEGKFVGRYGDRTLSQYRQMARQITGAACATGIISNDGTFDAVVQEWLNEFERVQLILKLSPSLRRKHGD